MPEKSSMTAASAGLTTPQALVHALRRAGGVAVLRRYAGSGVEKPTVSASQQPIARQTARSARVATQTPPAPLVLDRYRLHRRLGAGGFGTVWLARDERLDREVAVKIVPRARVVEGRLEREARATARLAHPAIVTLYEAAVDDEGAYLVSELVRGSTLDALLAQGRLSDRDIVVIAITLCDALAHAHAQGVVHRDVKPCNVLVPDAPASGAEVAKLTDFGVARVIGGDSVTVTGDVIGTLAYMAPEQAEGREAGAAADLYSLALVIYEALTGTNPVRVVAVAQRARRLGAYLPPLRRQRRDLPPELGRAVDLALRPRPRERGTIGELRSALVIARDQVADLPGVVSGRWRRGAEAPSSESGLPESPGGWPSGGPPRDEDRLPTRSPGVGPPSNQDAAADAGPRIGGPVTWVAPALGAVAAATLSGWLCSQLLHPSPLAPAAAGLVAGGLTLAAPRLGFIVLTASVCVAALFQQRAGAALLVLAGALVPMIMLARRPRAWPLAVAAPALGLIGLAGAWPALAARARTPGRRAALGATGWVWLALAGAISGHAMYLAHVPGTWALRSFGGSPGASLHHVLLPLITTGALAGAAVWGLAAVAAPVLIRGRSLMLDTVRVIVWAATVVSATMLSPGLVARGHELGSPPTALAGTFASAVVVLAPGVIAAGLALQRSSGSEAGLA
jgi:serine/threonine protein kinase